METKVYRLVNILMFSLTGCICDGAVGFLCDSCSGKLLILPMVLLNSPISATAAAVPDGENSKQLKIGVSATANGSILCLVGSTVFLGGHCFSCTRPLDPNLVKYDIDEVNKESLQGATNHLTSTHFISAASSQLSQVLLCPAPTSPNERQFSEWARVEEGKKYLNGKSLRIVTVERHPFVKVADNEFDGVVFELLRALQEKHNFTSKIFLPYDGNWGSEKNGTWNGMVGQVLRNEADLGAAGFSVTLERAKVIDFSMSFHQEPTGILIPAPMPGNKLTILVRPLKLEVWLAVFTTICVLVPSLFVMHIVSLRLRRKVDHDDISLHKPVNMSRLIVDLIQFIIGSLVQEGMISPVNKTSRFLILLWWFVTLVLANIYVGYMVSFLSAPKLFDLVDSLEGLLSQSTLQWTYRKSTALQDLFQSNKSGVYMRIGSRVQENDLSTSDLAGVEKVLSGRWAFLKEKSFLDVAIGSDFMETHRCRMTIADQTFFTVGFALIVQKGSPFLELLDREILNVVTTGLMEKWKRIHWPRHLYCVNAAKYIVSTQPKARKLTLDDCQGVYFLLLVGLSLASIAFIMEIRKRRHSCLKLGASGAGGSSCNSTKGANPTATAFCDSELKGYKIIVIPVKEDIYHKIHKLNLLFKGSSKRCH